MLEVAPAEPWHILDIDVQPRHVEAKRLMCSSIDRIPLDGALTLLRDGRPVAVGGIHDGLGWALLGKDLRRGEMVVVHRIARHLLSVYNRDVLAEIDESHPEAVRWARMLGLVRVMEGTRCTWYAYSTL